LRSNGRTDICGLVVFNPVATPLTLRVGDTVPRGRLVGALVDGEDRAAIERILVLAPDLALEGEAELLTHADLDPTASDQVRSSERQRRLDQLRAGKLKRYVLLIDTPAGQRIVKIAEINSIGNVLLGLLASSVSRKEHAFHLHAEELDLAAARTLGFLEWRSGVHMVRACQVQSLLAEDAPSLGAFLHAQLEAYGDAALESFAEALAATHRVPFFHADLKGFHAFVHDVTQPHDGAASYNLRWIDLARVAFGLSRRQRIINLYQALRFVVPTRDDAQEHFVSAYCRAAGWYANEPERALRKVRRLLEYKLRTHPLP
jgi:hypothetical protein